MRQYLQLLETILEEGTDRGDRTGTGTRSLFGYQMRIDLQKGFPLLTTKKVFFKGVVHELLWMLAGDTNVKYLQDNGVHIWDEWATEEQCAKFGREVGDLGPVYGRQWRRFGASPDGWTGPVHAPGVDQIAEVVRQIKETPESRRIIVTGWNPLEADLVALPPCHTLFQFYVRDRTYLDCQLYQRSADAFLGVPFNIASYALLTHMLASVCDLEAGHFIHTFGDLHIYNNHREQVAEQLSRTPRALPRIQLARVRKIDAFEYEDFVLEGYDPHPAIRAPVAV